MTNRYHRYINLPFELKKPKICETEPEHPTYIDDNPYGHFDENLFKWLRKFDLTVDMYETLYTPPYGYVPLHIDSHLQNKELAKLNLSWGCEKSAMSWYTTNKLYVMNRGQHHEDTVRDLELGDIESTDNYKFLEHIDPDVTILHGVTDEYQVTTAKRAESTLIYQANTNRPSLVNGGILHSTENPCSVGRWTLSIVMRTRFNKELDWESALKIFADYLEE